jgi:hypothetical protein
LSASSLLSLVIVVIQLTSAMQCRQALQCVTAPPAALFHAAPGEETVRAATMAARRVGPARCRMLQQHPMQGVGLPRLDL